MQMQGLGVSKGIAQGVILKYDIREIPIPSVPVENPEQETARFQDALRSVIEKNRLLKEETLKRVGEAEAEIFDAHQMLLDDEDSVIFPVQELILKDGKNAEIAVNEQFSQLEAMMLALEDDYMRQRAEDIADLKNQLLRELLNIEPESISSLKEKTILVTQDLTPADIIRMDIGHVSGIVCEQGGPVSHMAILARAMEIPAIVRCEAAMADVKNGQAAIMDGESGILICEPSREQRAELEARETLK